MKQNVYGFLCLISMALLSGCTKYLNEDFLTSEDYQNYGWAILSDKKYRPCPLFCYKTLASIDCFRTPQTGRENQLVDFIDFAGQPQRCFIDEGFTEAPQQPY